MSGIGKPDFNKLFLDAFPIMMNDNNGPYNYISIFFFTSDKKNAIVHHFCKHYVTYILAGRLPI